VLQAPPVGSGAKPQPLNHLVHIRDKKNGSGDNTVMDFESKYLFKFSGVSPCQLSSLQKNEEAVVSSCLILTTPLMTLSSSA